MHDLITLDRTAVGSLSVEEVESVLGYAANATAESTRIAYDGDMAAFRHWCTAKGACPLPASPAVVAAYLAHLADSGRKASGIGRAAAGIAYHHRQAGIDPSPTAHEVVRQTMHGVRRTIGTKKNGKAAATADIIAAMLKVAPDNTIGTRDKAMLCLCFAGALRRSELVALNIDDLVQVPDGIRLQIRRSKTDQTGEGVELPIIRGTKLRPVECIDAWLAVLAAAGVTSGAVFRGVRLGGKISEERLSTNGFAGVVKRYAERIGLDPAIYSGHSMRAGFLTSSAESGSSLIRMADHSRHKSLDTLRGYVRRVDMWKDHPGHGIL